MFNESHCILSISSTVLLHDELDLL
jgi:hypothetical protein